MLGVPKRRLVEEGKPSRKSAKSRPVPGTGWPEASSCSVCAPENVNAPRGVGFVSVLVTGALIYFISLQMTTSVFVTNMASMIGIGVAIDYSLFILARYREEREAGRDRDEARSRALSTSGLAVTFSGLAVIISLAGLWMVDNQALRSMALGAMTVVAVSIGCKGSPARWWPLFLIWSVNVMYSW